MARSSPSSKMTCRARARVSAPRRTPSMGEAARREEIGQGGFANKERRGLSPRSVAAPGRVPAPGPGEAQAAARGACGAGNLREDAEDVGGGRHATELDAL